MLNMLQLCVDTNSYMQDCLPNNWNCLDIGPVAHKSKALIYVCVCVCVCIYVNLHYDTTMLMNIVWTTTSALTASITPASAWFTVKSKLLLLLVLYTTNKRRASKVENFTTKVTVYVINVNKLTLLLLWQLLLLL